ncbi:MAG: hypothetical protein WB816_01425 [Methylocystis sp.]
MSDAANRLGTGQLIGVRMQPDELEAIDAYRRDLPGVPSRPEAIRRLCSLALDPRADNAAAPAPRPLREFLQDFFDADPSRVGSFIRGHDDNLTPAEAVEFSFSPEDDTTFSILQRAARDVLETFRRHAREGDPAARELCIRMRAILDDKAIADQDQYLTSFAKSSRRPRPR